MADHVENALMGLANGTGPSRNDVAKACAMKLALKSFDDEQKKSGDTQGSGSRDRFINAIMHLWSRPMKKKYLLSSIAATLIIAPAAYIAFDFQSASEKQYDTSIATVQKAPTDTATLQGGATLAPQSTLELAQADQAAAPAAQEDTSIAMIVSNADAKAKAIEMGLVEAMGLSSGQMSADVMSEPQVMALMSSNNRFTSSSVNSSKNVSSEPVSTFSIDVDTASYSHARRAIMSGALPDPDSVRVEEMINYFPYDWQGPKTDDKPFEPTVTVMPTPWNSDTQLLHIGIRGYDVPVAAQAASNLVFLVDVSGSMNQSDKLPLLKSAFRMFVSKLKPTDTVSIVAYAGASGVVLEPTKASDADTIFRAIDNLNAGGGTNGAAGIEEAYRLAEKSFVKDGVNRIFLATDGDFNVGASGDDELKRLVEQKRKSGIYLSVLGFGGDNYNDGLMQTLAQNGNGVAAYIDTLSEAQKTLVQEASASLFTIAKDVKIQVEFNPSNVSAYRLIGYETRALATEDFNNDKVDAGEVGSGHRVTAIYEIVPKGSKAVSIDASRYTKPFETSATTDNKDELAFLKIRYKQPGEDQSRLISMPVLASSAAKDIVDVSTDVKFSVAVAAFGQKLKHEAPVEDYGWSDVKALALQGRGDDAYGYRSEFLKILDIAESLPVSPAIDLGTGTIQLQ